MCRRGIRPTSHNSRHPTCQPPLPSALASPETLSPADIGQSDECTADLGLLLFLHAFPAMRKGMSCRQAALKGCHNCTPCWTRQTQKRPDQRWARCSVLYRPCQPGTCMSGLNVLLCASVLRRAWKRLLALHVKIGQQYNTAPRSCAGNTETWLIRQPPKVYCNLQKKKGMTCSVTYNSTVLHVIQAARRIRYESNFKCKFKSPVLCFS